MTKILSILTLFLALNVQGQVTESWNLDIDQYTHNSSTYVTKHPPIEVALFSNNDMIILFQKGTFTKINSKGAIIWKKEIEACAQQRILIDKNNTITVSCGTTISKYNTDGTIIWEKDYSDRFTEQEITFDAITTYKGNLYIAGHFIHENVIFQLALDQDGNILWKTSFEQEIADTHSLIPPKEIIIYKDQIITQAEHYSASRSVLYSSDLDGKISVKKPLDYKIKKLKPYNGSLIAVGQSGTFFNDDIIVNTVDINLTLSNFSTYSLPRNALISTTSSPDELKPIQRTRTNYTVNDFEFLDVNTIIVVGDSNVKPWIINLGINNKIIRNWDPIDTRYIKFNNENTHHSYQFTSIHKIGDKFLVSGIHKEEDDKEDLFTTYPNLFIRALEIKK